jgi:hypothetical protein
MVQANGDGKEEIKRQLKVFHELYPTSTKKVLRNGTVVKMSVFMKKRQMVLVRAMMMCQI